MVVVVSSVFASVMHTELDTSNLLTWILEAVRQNPSRFRLKQEEDSLVSGNTDASGALFTPAWSPS